jgi:hypothetical protein
MSNAKNKVGTWLGNKVQADTDSWEEHVVMMTGATIKWAEPKVEVLDVDSISPITTQEEVDNKSLSISTGDMTEKARLKLQMNVVAQDHGFASAEQMYAQVMAKQIADQFALIAEWKKTTMTRSDEVLSKYLKEYAEVMWWKDLQQEVKIESNVRKLTTKERLSR